MDNQIVIPSSIKGGNDIILINNNETEYKINNNIIKYKLIKKYKGTQLYYIKLLEIFNIFNYEMNYDSYLVKFNIKLLDLYFTEILNNKDIKFHIIRLINYYDMKKNIKDSLHYIIELKKDIDINKILSNTKNKILNINKSIFDEKKIIERFNELINNNYKTIEDKIDILFNIEILFVPYLNKIEKEYNNISNNLYRL